MAFGLLILSLSFLIVGDTVALEIYVDPTNGNDSACLGGLKSDISSGVNQPCSSLEFVSRHLGGTVSNVSIIINSTSLSLNESVTFSNRDEINITGGIKDTPTNISCDLSPYCFKDVTIGLLVYNVSKISISNLLIHACGTEMEVTRKSSIFSAFQLHNCRDITFMNMAFQYSVYNGLLITNSLGEVSISNVNFTNNVVPSNCSIILHVIGYYPSGMYLMLNSTESSTSRYSISHCNFIDNYLVSYSDDIYTHYKPEFVPHLMDDVGLGLGGGMGIVIMENVTQIILVINSSTFMNNKAPSGAGLCVQFQDHVYNNSIQIVSTNFINNHAFFGGGGVCIRFQKCSQKNIVMFQRILFSNNSAKYGGGTSIIARVCDIDGDSDRDYKHSIVTTFYNCTWLNNSGTYSPAIDASPFSFDHLSEGIFPMVVINDSSFMNNHMNLPRKQLNTNESFYANSGVFTVARLSVHFSGHICFKTNMFSALVLISASAEFRKGSHISFVENTGFKGGAILMYGISSLKAMDNSYFEFIRNKALIDGGAIYYETIQPLDFFNGRSCFLQYKGTEGNVLKRNLTFVFRSNKAKHSGNSIYASTFYGCFFHYLNDLNVHHSITDFLKYIGNFSFDETLVKTFSSYGQKFVGTMSSVKSIPGKIINFELKLLDEFNNYIDTNFAVQVDEDSSGLELKYPFTDGSSAHVYGEEGASGTLIFSQQSTVHKVYYRIHVTLQDCSPGYFFDNHYNSCKCAADVQEYAYPFMYYCNYSEFRAYIERSHWVGYYPSNKTDPKHLYTSFCPSQFCRLSKLVSSNHLLPNSSKGLNDFVCVENRTGILCGLCKPGFSTLYHSRQLSCSNVSKHECSLGVIYYILSEIIPVSILFAVVVLFDLSFTSGSVNCLIFFSQIQNYITIDFSYYTDADSQVFNQTYLLSLQHGYHLIYGVINMEFLNIDLLSFCLFKNSHVMDILIFEYVTTIYALVLILLLIGLLNCCKCEKLCRMRKRLSAKRSVTNGVSAFLVICYTQCARVTFYILMKADLFGNKIMGKNNHVTVTYYGGLPYFKNEHLYYAIPAVLVLVTFIILFPLYLLLFPLILHLLALCGLSEHSLVTKMLHLLQVNRLKPLLDTFQFSFKDRMRFFAGLYFLYRVAILSVHSSFQGNNQLFLGLSVVLLVIFLGINSVVQPYISRKHNIIDSLLFLNLAAINGLTLFCIKSQTRMDRLGKINYTLALSIGVLQLILLYLPLFVCVCILLYKFLRVLHHRLCFMKSTTEVADEEEREVLLDDNGSDTDYNSGDTSLLAY